MSFNCPEQQKRVNSEVPGTRIAHKRRTKVVPKGRRASVLHLAGGVAGTVHSVTSREKDSGPAFLLAGSQLSFSAGSEEETATGWCWELSAGPPRTLSSLLPTSCPSRVAARSVLWPWCLVLRQECEKVKILWLGVRALLWLGTLLLPCSFSSLSFLPCVSLDRAAPFFT